MISESQQEQAALHALGLLDDDEAAGFQRALDADADLRALAGELREAAALLTYSAGPETLPPPDLKARVLTEAARMSPGGPVAPGKIVRGPWTTWVPWALAAAAAGVALLSVLDRNHLMRDRDRMYEAMMAANFQRAQETAAQPPGIPIMQVAACQLEPTPGGPAQPRATVVWDPKHREGALIVTQLKPPGEGHDYQLWAVEEGHKDTVSAGVVRVDPGGSSRIAFKPTDTDRGKVQAFALSLEQAGGSEKNQGPILLLGKL